eukprot:CAMPEP_0118845038 /NCGR_PEP_ID=MMETSP1162-20130426/87863_1 /TAXON_ID=33656 /ORGANISM="Phaeocystis Sp, Strain CCMP2710" /LENGTH=97 /DNA_ID=CAMNT_0006777177 /DNA_START=56 /DNA_END=349 /DNA_ORIENTATION=+
MAAPPLLGDGFGSHAAPLVLKVELHMYRLHALEHFLEHADPHLHVVAQLLLRRCELGVRAHLLPAGRGAARHTECPSRDEAVESRERPFICLAHLSL